MAKDNEWDRAVVEAERDLYNGVTCAENQAQGRGPCGSCVTCLRADLQKEIEQYARLENRFNTLQAKLDRALADNEQAFEKLQEYKRNLFSLAEFRRLEMQVDQLREIAESVDPDAVERIMGE